jgi:hypothetical protein
MRSRFSSALLLAVLLTAQTLYARTAPAALARQATSTDSSEAARAISELRQLGPAGLDTLRQVYLDEINRQVAHPLTTATPEWRRISLALDTVSQQKDSYLSGLYWYTDLAEAKSAARAAGKPILSLRLLGKLNEEFSCANSRFFRTVLYSNSEVSKMLRENFILHWQSVRPAPRVTIDFGDGRKLERTLTGNSIHYVLDADGHPIDALPGLYGPTAFFRQLTAIAELTRRSAASPDANWAQTVSLYQRERLNKLTLAWLADIERTGGKIPEGFVVTKREDGTPEALKIAKLAITKMVTEETILRSMMAGSEALEKVTDRATWEKIAVLHFSDALLDERSIGLIQRQTLKALKAEVPQNVSDESLTRLVEKLQSNIALDTVRNEYLMHPKLYGWLIADRNRSDIDAFNKRVYDELFLTPASDSWLGLLSPETYVALEGGGIVR